MSKYFHLSPLGTGTDQVEGLASYVTRLARIHGVTRHQLITHIQWWWMRSCERRLPRCETVRLNGHSPDVFVVIEALEAATGEARLDRCTISALAGICAANCVGSVRHSRAWCPACFRDDIAAGRDTYDRLIWQLQPVERCTIHRSALVNQCFACGHTQHGTKRTPHVTHICWSCGADLSSQQERDLYRAQPYFGEAQALALVRSIASSQGPSFQPNACGRYIEALRQHINDAQLKEALREIFHCDRMIPKRPQLQALLGFSVYFGVDIEVLLTDPELAASQTSMRFPTAMPPVRPRNLAEHRGEKGKWFKQKLQEAINGPGPYLSPRKFCAAHDYSHSMAHHTCGSLMHQLSVLWRKQRVAEAKNARVRARSALSSRRSQPARQTVRQLTRAVATEANAPVHVVRKVIKELRS